METKQFKQLDNPTLEAIAIEQDNEAMYQEDLKREYSEEERRNRREAELENERNSWNIN